MKILFLHCLANPNLGGGAEAIVWEQIRGLSNDGHECVLLATSDQAGLNCTIQEGIRVWLGGIRNVYWPFHKNQTALPLRLLWHVLDSYNPLMQGYLRHVIEQERPDVASFHNLSGWSAASWNTVARLRVPAVQILHDHYSICLKTTMYNRGRNCRTQCAPCRLFRMQHKLLSKKVQAVVGVSHFILNRHKTLGYFESVPIQRVIHNSRSPKTLGVDDERTPKKHFGVRFGYIGRLAPSKGIELLIDAFLDINLQYTELWIAGSGKQWYIDHLREKTNYGRVHFLGQVSARNFYPEVDVVIVPSLSNDNLPSVVFEALAFGKPVIGSQRGGIPEMVRHRENGLLFNPESPGKLRAALEAMSNDDLRSSLSKQARSSAESFLDIAGWIQSYEALYREAASAWF